MGKMNNLGISILLFLTVTANAFPKYNGYDQPEYEVLKKLDGYELRRYAPSNWVASEVNALTFDAESSTNFWNLYGYINGGNADSQKMKMTVPVITSVGTRKCAFCNVNYKMHFYMHQQNIPQPTDSDVTKVALPSIEVYVKTFSGYANGEEWLTEASKLHDMLKRDEVSDDQIKTDEFYAVGYDGPLKLVFRRNEVWIVKY